MRVRASSLFAVAATLLPLCGTAAAAPLETGYEAYADWSSLPRLKSYATGMASSYNRSAADSQSDYNNFDGPAPTPGYSLVREVTGQAGVITRFWMPQYTSEAGNATVRITLDGTTFQGDVNSFLAGGAGGTTTFTKPLIRTLLGGRVSYEPMGFQNSMRIEMAWTSKPVFYQFEYRTQPTGTGVPAYTGTLSTAQQAARAKAADVLSHPAVNPAADGSATLVPRTNLLVPAGTAMPLATVTGASGQVQGFTLNLKNGTSNPDPAVLDGLRVRVRYDGNATPAIDVPVSQFFGVGHGRNAYQSLPLGVAADGSYYSHWPMPYRQGVSVELYNATGADVTVPSASVEYKAGPVAADAGYLYARYNAQTTTAGQAKYNLLHVNGTGHYVGNILSVKGVGGSLEGNDTIAVNGVTVANGTGLEDAYNGGYYYNTAGTPYDIPQSTDPAEAADKYPGLFGLLRFAGQTETEQYRWRIGDAVPFSGDLSVDIQNTSFGGNPGGVEWGSTAFYYMVPEPGSATALAAAATGLLLRRRRVRPHAGV